VIGTATTVTAALTALVLVGALSVTGAPGGRFVDRWMMAILELIAAATLVIALGPAIRRFGRGYAEDLWPVGAAMPSALLRVLDLAYYLVFAGYVLVTVDVDGGATLAGQLSDAAQRLGGLLLIMGLLHGATLVALPIVALIDTSTRRRRPLPRWFVWLCVALTISGAPLLVPMLIGLVIGGVS
jgi:hypothetical protein